ncbi:peptidoglycan DD-metalloendopeptidase family protein [Oceanobacillus chungangensis]|uniref:Peptidase M23 n=1 Tax=Oceanobacillus chungangensis TaxID=1229152 RepID=A0A3D8Q0Z5_9BACI|nr:peptidoglycan DD-metalloendopeptidase family protein [Oceanobacillus chungangensis]RDW22116.1 peptidase M23 [Oceanobacillus chungangensis]
MTFEIMKLFVFQMVLPTVFITSLWKGTFHSKLDWMIQAMYTVLLTTWIFISSPWDWFSYYLRFILLFFLLLATYKSWKKIQSLPFRIKYNNRLKMSLSINVLFILIFGAYNVFTFSGFTTKGDAIELDFPLKNGTYYVGQGGNHVQINYHNAYPRQQYALDIVKLNKFGNRAAGIYPEELDKYVIYGDRLFSPCTGSVLEVRNDLPDLTPPDTDLENAGGNFANLLCESEDVIVYIAHMQEGSVVVKEGESIQKGQPIGLVGNSGNTSEPHLHIHAEKNGEGVPIHFNGRFLIRNSLVW